MSTDSTKKKSGRLAWLALMGASAAAVVFAGAVVGVGAVAGWLEKLAGRGEDIEVPDETQGQSDFGSWSED